MGALLRFQAEQPERPEAEPCCHNSKTRFLTPPSNLLRFPNEERERERKGGNSMSPNREDPFYSHVNSAEWASFIQLHIASFKQSYISSSTLCTPSSSSSLPPASSSSTLIYLGRLVCTCRRAGPIWLLPILIFSLRRPLFLLFFTVYPPPPHLLIGVNLFENVGELGQFGCFPSSFSPFAALFSSPSSGYNLLLHIYLLG